MDCSVEEWRVKKKKRRGRSAPARDEIKYCKNRPEFLKFLPVSGVARQIVLP